MRRFTVTACMRPLFASTNNRPGRLPGPACIGADTPETAWSNGKAIGNRSAAPRPSQLMGKQSLRNLNVRDVVGTFKACTREFSARPQNGEIEIQFTSTPGHEAMIQALEMFRSKIRPS